MLVAVAKWTAARPLIKLWVRLAMDRAVPIAEGTHNQPAESFSKWWAIVWEAGRRMAFIWSESGCLGYEASCSFPNKRVNVEAKEVGLARAVGLSGIRIFEGPTTTHPQAEASAEANPKLS